MDVFPERYRNVRETCANFGQFNTGKTQGNGSLSGSRFNSYPLPSLLPSTARAHFFLRQESIRAIFLVVALIVIGLRSPRQLRWAAGFFFSVSADESFISLGESYVNSFY